MKKLLLIILPVLVALTWSCGSSTNSANTEQKGDSTVAENSQKEENPASEGFDAENSDKRAVDIANAVMKASGGRQNWDETRLIAWDFFGRRRLFWDKKTGDVRIDFKNGKRQMIVNVYNKEGEPLKGKVIKDSVEITQADSLQKYLKQAKSIWINDMYWLCMPFKLKDSGVTLKYTREDTVQNGQKADVLTLTFKEVGDTPQNKYEVYVDKQTNMVAKWAFFREAKQDSANFIMPWLNYQKYGNLMFSDDRGRAKLSNIKVTETVPEKLFTSFEKIDLE